jgi:hypothetical protein
VNTDAPDEWALYRAERRVLEIQTKLHRWAIEDPDRRFDDLFNLVTDPAFLLVAWDRVRSNKGARTARGRRQDRLLHREQVRVRGVPRPAAVAVEGPQFPAGCGAGADDSQNRRQAAPAGHPHGGGIVTGRPVTIWVSSSSRIRSIR